MAERMPCALSLVERGWQGSRESSQRLGRQGISVIQLVKGRLPSDIDDLVPPEPWLRLRGFSRSWFRFAVWFHLAWPAPAGRIRWLMTDNERTLREVRRGCRAAGIRPILIHETMQGYELLEDGQLRTFEEVFGPARACA